jgi:hypothetical protein
MAIVNNLDRAITHAAKDVPHSVKPDIMKMKVSHLLHNALSDFVDLSLHTGDRYDLTQEPYNPILLSFHMGSYLMSKFVKVQDLPFVYQQKVTVLCDQF